MLIIGVGNESRGDDGVGKLIARQVRAALLREADVLEMDGESAELIAAWQQTDRAILIDAMRSGQPVGTIVRFDASIKPLPQEFARVGSTHSFGVAEAIELSRTLGTLPRQVIVFGIEGESFENFKPLSPEVAAAIPEVIKRILKEINT
ncbi:MAG: hydrogenase maturation protease [bacterium]|nr:hydrogenase maturation protease [bacterium]